MGNPPYHLRPHKAVDRNLFVEAILRLGRIIDLSEYRYIGFGSYEFDEYKLIYRMLGITDLHSIEKDSDVFCRQSFNKPYAYIHLFNKTCTAYFDEKYDDTKQSIIWADFSIANEKYSQCSDMANICSKLKTGDILRVTLNANASGIPTGNKPASEIPSVDRRKHRYEWLKNELKEFFPDRSSEEDITEKSYPLFLLKTIKKAVYRDLDNELFVCPICCYVYSDNTQMMTLTMLIGSSESKEDTVIQLQKVYKDWADYVSIDSWDRILQIDLPALTVHEQLEIAQYDRTEEGIEKILKVTGISREDLIKYWRFSRYYPNYQPVII